MNSLFPNLLAVMEKNGITVENLAKALGHSENVVQLKLSGVLDWTLTEALMICSYLNHYDLKLLFLR